MISCTEFIPAYSELFTYLHNNYGRSEVERFWEYLFAPTGKGIPLINFAKKEGLRGCWKYWEGTLTEEAADVTKWMNEKEGWIYSEMHYCPSKGRLLELEKEIGLVPYYDYCGHCDYYRSHLNMVGLDWTRNHMHVDKAQCQSLIFDPKIFKGIIIPDENMEILDVNSKDREYFHPDFHSSLNMGIDFVAKEHGEDALTDFLIMYTNDVYKPVFAAMEKDPVEAIETKIRETYKLEKSEDALVIEKDDNKLSVKILYCPAVKHLKATGRDVSKWFKYSTEIVMKVLAEKANLDFSMLSYDEETGACEYVFIKK